MTQWTRYTWNKLSSEQRLQWLQELVTRLPEGFALGKIQSFDRYGQQIETGIFSYQQSEFVFVPGDEVTLGWNNDHVSWDQSTLEDLENGLEEIELTIDEAIPMITKQMSPVRTVHIPSLLVERRTHSVGWQEYTLAELDPIENKEIIDAHSTFSLSNYSSHEMYQDYRFVRDGQQIRIYVFEETEDAYEWQKISLEHPFTILTEDEWEYVYGGGARTLFPWGDHFDYTMNVKHFGNLNQVEDDPSNTESGLPYDLEQPNGFGICFLGDPYEAELTITADDEVIDKGSDGGSGICGGVGVLLGYLPVATYYRNPYQDQLEWNERISSMHYRRIIRL